MAPVQSVFFVARNPRLMKYMLVPWLVTFLFVLVAVFVLVVAFPDLFRSIWPEPSGFWYDLVHDVVSVLFWIVISTLVMLTGFLVGQVAAAPAYVLLAERVREQRVGPVSDNHGGVYVEYVDPVLGEAFKLALFIVLQALLFPLNFLPGAGSVLYLILSSLVSLFWIALEFFDYALDTVGPLTTRERLTYIFQNAGMTFGFATGMFVVLSIPLVNVFLAPLGVVGATLLHVERFEDGSDVKRSK